MKTSMLLSLGAAALVTLSVAAPAATSLRATSVVPRTAPAGNVPVEVRLANTSAEPVDLTLTRSSSQSCSFGPDVRVLQVGTREVVYPRPGASPSICTQEVRSVTVPANGAETVTRFLDLPAGEYMVEVWLNALSAQGERVRLPAEPRRVTVR